MTQPTTLALYRDDSYLNSNDAVITHITDTGFAVDQTVFYAMGGGQPGDTGYFTRGDALKHPILDTRQLDGHHLHLASPDILAQLTPGDRVTLTLDWERRHRLMRMHSCMHMLCALIPAPVTGGSIQPDRGRLDFDLSDTVDKERLTTALNALIHADHKMSTRWITDDELDAQPELVRTMSAKPPRGSGKVRLVNFDGIDLQPCGGTHVNSTAEIGRVKVSKVEKKGRQNRRISVVFDDGEP